MNTKRMLTEKWRGILAVIGGCLVMLSCGTVYSYGNISPYVTSYIRERSKPADLRIQESSAIFAVNMGTLGFMIPAGGGLLGKIGYRPTVILGSLIMSVGVILSFEAIKLSFYLMIITYGFMLGIGVGIAYMAPVVCALKWFPKYKGRVSGIAMAGFGGGSLIFDHIQTAYINPMNFSPNASLHFDSDERYFDDAEILDKVPSSFLLLGSVYLVMMFTGMLLLFDPPEDAQVQTEMEQLLSEPNGLKEDEFSLHPREVVKTLSFWQLWGTFICCGVVMIVIPSLYKAYGQTFISDDKFLTTVGAIGAIFNGGGRIWWGFITDATSYKTAMLAMCASYTVLILTLMASPYGGKIMYFIWICALFSLIGGTFTLLASAAAWAYGTKHVGVNFGLLISGLSIVGPLGVILPMTLQDIVGWNGLFIIMASLCVLGFLLTLTFNARRANGDIV